MTYVESYVVPCCLKQGSHLCLSQPNRFVFHSYFKPNRIIRLIQYDLTFSLFCLLDCQVVLFIHFEHSYPLPKITLRGFKKKLGYTIY